MPAAEPLGKQSAGHLREPVVDAREEAQHRPAEEDVMEVRDDEVRVGRLEVERHDRERDAGEPSDDEHRDESDREEHRGAKPNRPADSGGDQVEDLNAGGDGYEHPRGVEEEGSDADE